MCEPRFQLDRVIAAQKVDDLDVERPPSGGTAWLVCGSEIDPRIVRQASRVEVFDAAVVDRVDQVPVQVGPRHELSPFVLHRGDPQPDRCRVREAAGNPGGGSQVPPAGEPVATDGVERVTAVVLERVASPVALPVGTTPGVGQQSRRDRRAAERFLRKLLKGQGREPRRLITDKLRSYSAAHRTVLPSVVHSTAQYENNRAEVSHQPTRQRERQMRRFKSAVHAQRFLSVHGLVQNLFRVGRHLLRAVHHRSLRTRSFRVWDEVTCAC